MPPTRHSLAASSRRETSAISALQSWLPPVPPLPLVSVPPELLLLVVLLSVVSVPPEPPPLPPPPLVVAPPEPLSFPPLPLSLPPLPLSAVPPVLPPAPSAAAAPNPPLPDVSVPSLLSLPLPDVAPAPVLAEAPFVEDAVLAPSEELALVVVEASELLEVLIEPSAPAPAGSEISESLLPHPTTIAPQATTSIRKQVMVKQHTLTSGRAPALRDKGLKF